MKNLDTEISSLTTEYDTVKNTIAKNIENHSSGIMRKNNIELNPRNRRQINTF